MTQRTRRFARSSARQPQLSARAGHFSIAPATAAAEVAKILGGAQSFVIGLAVSVAILAPGLANAVCTPDPPMNNDTVTCTDEISNGYDVSGAENLTISIEGSSTFDDSGPGLDSAIRIGNETELTIGEDSVIDVTVDGQFGIQGDDNNFIDNGGTININVANGRGIKIQNNSSGILPNGVVNGATGSIFANGNGSIAIESGTNAGIATNGLIELNGANTIGISAGSRVNLTSDANITNNAGATLDIKGADSFGIKAGDNWIDGSVSGSTFTPSTPGIRNLSDLTDPGAPLVSSILVSGDRSIGIFAGDESNTDGDHNSFVSNGRSAVIDVTGEDAIGISVGGNDRVAVDDSSAINLYTVVNFGTISGDEDAGALIEIRNSVEGFENRVFNADIGEIFADVTNLGTANRGIAINGSSGDDFLDNVGAITGDALFGDGADRYRHREGATFQDTIELGDGDNTFENFGTFDATVIFGIDADMVRNTGTIDGDLDLDMGDDTYTHGPDASVSGMIAAGDGDDTIELENFADTTPRTFDLSDTSGFENIRLMDGPSDGAWILEGTSGFAGLVEVLDGATLQFDVPTTLAGDLEIEDAGNLTLALDGSGTPLTIQGDATLDGDLTVEVDTDGLTPETTYRVIDVLGTLTGEFDEVEFSAASLVFQFTEDYDASGLFVFFEAFGLEAAARGRSQVSIARYLEAIDAEGGATTELQTLIDGLFAETGSASTVFAALIPEAYDVQTTIAAESGRRITQHLFDRPRECQTGERNFWSGSDAPISCHARSWSPWVSAIGSLRSRDGFAGHPEYDARMGGVVIGLDTPSLGEVDFTLALATQSGTIEVNDAGESDLTMVDLTGQAAFNLGPLRTQGAVTWGHGFHDDNRRVAFIDPGTDTRTSLQANTDHESDRVTIAAELGLLFKLGRLHVEPLAGVDWTWINQEEIKEAGNIGGLGVQIEERDEEIASLSAGVRLSTEYEQSRYIAQQLEWMDGVWRPQVDLRWRQILSGYDRSIRSRLRGAPDTAGRFSIDGKEDQGGVEIGAGLSFVPEYANRLQIDLQYQAFLASHTLDQDLIARVTFGF